jgi:hypothetical protein
LIGGLMAETDPAVAAVTGDADNHKGEAKDNQQGASDWAKDFDEGIRKRIEKFKTPADLAKGYVELETYSSKGLQDMTDSEKEKFFKRLGLPESPEGYELSGVTLPEGIPQNPDADKAFKELAKSLRLTKDQAKGGHEWLMKRAATAIIAQRAASKKQAEDAENSLRTSWATAYDANQAAVEKVIRLGGDKFVQFMNNGPGKDPTVREGLLAISKMFADETLVSGKPPGKQKTEGTVPQGFVFDPSKSPELVNK